ncbi:MAG: YggS family pyridoxal phosphate-dependent enzyme [Alphaproteobacteria bacterium]|nr:YggS family pyridoxal phosphate-dependent enzyme [Alphaproteobacteria bacterium]MCB9686050.1 YggS family pyridoxal phosphate-dependent enzyme [Alphaproteobacteria bacterium]
MGHRRPETSVRLMLVTKTVPPIRIKEAMDLGYSLFGENRVQEAVGKYAGTDLGRSEIPIIGHLQRNKVKPMLRFASCLQSVDREALVVALERHVDPSSPLDVLIQVNTSLEDSKYGVPPEALWSLAERVEQSRHLRLQGLMTIGRLGASPEEARPGFRLLRELRDELLRRGFPKATELSMGMSRDLEVAIEEGATLVRVGTAVFGTRPTSDLDYWPPSRNG